MCFLHKMLGWTLNLSEFIEYLWKNSSYVSVNTPICGALFTEAKRQPPRAQKYIHTLFNLRMSVHVVYWKIEKSYGIWSVSDDVWKGRVTHVVHFPVLHLFTNAILLNNFATSHRICTYLGTLHRLVRQTAAWQSTWTCPPHAAAASSAGRASMWLQMVHFSSIQTCQNKTIPNSQKISKNFKKFLKKFQKIFKRFQRMSKIFEKNFKRFLENFLEIHHKKSKQSHVLHGW